MLGRRTNHNEVILYISYSGGQGLGVAEGPTQGGRAAEPGNVVRQHWTCSRPLPCDLGVRAIEPLVLG